MREIKFYNSLSDKKEVFIPNKVDEVTMYVCGPTVYNHLHIGNCRPLIVFDVLVRFLRKIGYKVNYISNITDVDDKIINASISAGIEEKEFTQLYIDSYFELRKSLNVLVPDYTPKVTEYIPQIIDFVSELVKKENAYVVNGEVFFDISKIKSYGELSKININDLISGSRVEENINKKNPLDFLLWKSTEKGIKWKSPFSEGRPGWHTECVVMINSIAQQFPIDIHGGGFDLKFPHHENEIAQAKAYSNQPLANYWLHNGFINLDNEKMSKSLGNFTLGKDIVKQYPLNAFKLVLLEASYRAPVNYSSELMQSALKEANKIATTLKKGQLELYVNDLELELKDDTYLQKALEILADDLNTPNVITLIFELIKKINTNITNKELNSLSSDLANLIQILDVLGLTYDILNLVQDDILNLKAWQKAREEKNYVEADRLRQLLANKNLI
jgi:cysteinyl-tRNA synthetase